MKSGHQIICDKLLAASSTQVVTVRWLREGYSLQITTAAAGNAVYKLRKANVLVSSGRGRYLIRKDKLDEYLKGKSFYETSSKKQAIIKQLSSIGGDEETTRNIFKNTPSDEQIANTPAQTPTSPCDGDIDVINKLLDALAQAEPILRKYQKICAAVNGR